MFHHRRFGKTGILLSIALIVAPVASFAEEEESEKAIRLATAFNADPSQTTHSGSDATDGAPPRTLRLSKKDWTFGFHGYFRAPINMSFDKHPVMRNDLDDAGNPIRGADGLFEQHQDGSDWRFNLPPAVVDNQYNDWKYTNYLSGPLAELLFSYGNSIAVANVSIASWNITDSSWRKLANQLGVNQAWVTLNWPGAFGDIGSLKWNVGIFDNRYGGAGRYDAGRYDTYIVGRTHVGGETLTADFGLTDNLTLYLEHGFGAKTDVLRGNPKGDLTDVSADDYAWYGWAPYEGEYGTIPALVNHGHIGLLNTNRLWRELWLNLHIMHVFSNSADKSDDDQGAFGERDGKFLVLGGEAKLKGALFGDLYLGYSTTWTDGLAKMPNAIEILHSQGGWSFVDNYYGGASLTISEDGDDSRANEPNPGKGVVTTLEWQYMLSFARLFWGLEDKDYWGQGPDVQLSFYGMVNFIDPDNKIEPYLRRWAKKKVKLGSEVMYTPHKYFGLGLRFDRVIPDTEYDPNDDALNDSTLGSYAPFTVLSPKIRIKTAFVTHEEVNIAYVRYIWDDEGRTYSDGPVVRAEEDAYPGQRADQNALMFNVNMWW